MCEVSRLNDERQIQTLRNEMTQLQQVHRQQMATLQIQQEQELQQQYTLMNTKNEEIRNLQEQMTTMQYETSILVSDLQEQRNLVEQSELLASELVSVTKERDLVQQSLQDSHKEMMLLQNMILQHSSSNNNTKGSIVDTTEQDLLPVETKHRIVVDDIDDDAEIIAIIQRQQHDQRDTEMTALSTRVDELQSLLSTKEEILAEWTNQIEKLTATNEALCEQLSQKSERIQELECVADETRSQTEMERQNIDYLQLELTTKIVEIDDVTQKHNALEVEISHLNNTVESVRNELQAQQNEHNTKYSLLASDLERHQQRVAALDTEKSLIEHQLEEKINTILTLEKVTEQGKVETDSERSRAEVLQNDLTSLHREMMVLRKNASEVESNLRNDIQIHHEHVEELKLNCESLTSEIERYRALAEQVDTEKMFANELLNEKTKLMEENDNLLAQIGDLENAMEGSRRDTEKECDTLKALEQSLEELRQELDETAQHRSDLQLEVERMTHQCNHVIELESKCLELAGELDQCRTKADEVGTNNVEIEKLLLEKGRLLKVNEAFIQRLKAVEDVMHGSKQDAEVERKRAEQLKHDMELLKREFELTTQSRNDLEIKLNSIKVQFENLQIEMQELKELELKCQKLTSEVEHYRSLSEALKSEQTAEKESRLANLQSLQQKLDESEKDRKMLQIQLDTLQRTSSEQISANNDEVTQLHAVHGLLQDQMNASSMERNSLLQQIRQLKEGEGIRTEIVKQLEQQCRDLAAASDQAKQDNAMERTRAEKLTVDLTSIRQELNVAASSRDEIQLELEEANTKLVDLEIQSLRIGELESKCISLNMELESVQALANALDCDKVYLEELEAEKNRLLLANEERMAQVAILNQKMDQGEENKRNLHSELGKIQAAFNQEKASQLGEVAQLRSEQLNLKEHIKEIQRERDSLSERSELKFEELALVEISKQQLERQFAVMTDTANQVKLESEEHRRRADKLNEELSLLQVNLSDITTMRDTLQSEVDEANAKVSEMQYQQQRMLELEAKCLSLSSEVTQFQILTDAFENDKAYVHELEIEKGRLLMTNDELLTQINSLNHIIDQGKEKHEAEEEQLRVIHKSLQEQIENATRKYDALLLEHHVLKNEKAARIETIEQLEHRNCDLVVECEAAHKTAQKERSRGDELNRVLSLLQQDQLDAARIRHELESELNEVKVKFVEMKEYMHNVKELESKCHALSSQVEQCEELSLMLEEEQRQVEEQTVVNANLTKDIFTMTDQLNALQNQIVIREQTEHDLVTELDAIRSALVDKNTSNAENVTQLQVELRSLQEQLDTLSKDHELLLVEKQDREKQESDLLVTIQQLQLELQQITSKLHKAETEVKSQNSVFLSLQESESKIQELEAILRQRTEQIEEFDRRVEVLRTTLAQTEHVNVSDDDLHDLQEQVDTITKALQSTRDRLALREADLEQLHGRINEIRNQRDSSTTSIALNDASNSPRSTLMSHALQLQRSESTRAADFQRFQAERESTIDMLHRLNETVARYYSKV